MQKPLASDRHCLVAALLLLLTVCAGFGARVLIGQAPTTALPTRDRGREFALKVADGFTLATVGDLIELRPLSMRTDPGFAGAIKILKDADVAFGNMETNIADIPNFDAPFRGFVAVKEVAADVKALGIDMVNRANNHLPDGGIEGMFATDRLLDEAGLASPSHATLKRRLPAYAKEAWRRKISAACAAHAGLGRASLPLLSVTAGTAVMDLPGWPAAPGRTLRLRTDMRLRTDIEPTGCRPPSISCSSS
jgi:hypothetical protein